MKLDISVVYLGRREDILQFYNCHGLFLTAKSL